MTTFQKVLQFKWKMQKFMTINRIRSHKKVLKLHPLK